MAMDDSQVKQLLAGLPRASMIPTPHGSVAILCLHVESAGGNLDHIREWVLSNGGSEDTSEVRRPRGLRPGVLLRPPSRVERYFVVPAEVLA